VSEKPSIRGGERRR